MLRRTPGRAFWKLRHRYRTAARAGDWETCSLIVTELYHHHLEGQMLAELIYADGYVREQRDDTYNARRCTSLRHRKATPKRRAA